MEITREKGRFFFFLWEFHPSVYRKGKWHYPINLYDPGWRVESLSKECNVKPVFLCDYGLCLIYIVSDVPSASAWAPFVMIIISSDFHAWFRPCFVVCFLSFLFFLSFSPFPLSPVFFLFLFLSISFSFVCSFCLSFFSLSFAFSFCFFLLFLFSLFYFFLIFTYPQFFLSIINQNKQKYDFLFTAIYGEWPGAR